VVTLTSTRQADVLVVGAGVLGTFHAYFAALKGYKVLLVERNAFRATPRRATSA